MNNNQLKPFLVKSLIGAVIAGMLGLFLIEAAAIEAEKSVSRITTQLTKQVKMTNYFPGQGKLSAAGERLAANLQAMPPQRREELIALLRTIVVELRPFAIELLPLLEDLDTEK